MGFVITEHSQNLKTESQLDWLSCGWESLEEEKIQKGRD